MSLSLNVSAQFLKTEIKPSQYFNGDQGLNLLQSQCLKAFVEQDDFLAFVPISSSLLYVVNTLT